MKKKLSLIYDMDEAKEFIIQSNLIEDVSMKYAHEDALKAWKYATCVVTMTEKEVLAIHRILMKRFNPRIAGKLRTCDVWIGGQKKGYWSEAILSQQLGKVLQDVEGSLFQTFFDKARVAQDCHVEFEGVHPFEDGNGRVGRIVYNWHRLKLGLPIHIIHAGEEQFKYYDWFKKNAKR